jgi:hypothetical protein
MDIFSFHLAHGGIAATLSTARASTEFDNCERLVARRVSGADDVGASHRVADPLPSRQLAMFARWQSETAIDEFLTESKLGMVLAAGWHVRMEFLRRWGHVAELAGLPGVAYEQDERLPVVAVTLAAIEAFAGVSFRPLGQTCGGAGSGRPGDDDRAGRDAAAGHLIDL